MKKPMRIVTASVCALALAGSFAMFGCSSNTETAEEPKAQEQAAASDSMMGEQVGAEPAEPAEQVELQIFAANSLEKALNEVQALYTEQTGVTFADTQYEASGTLNEMLGGGATADIEITASKGTMDTAVKEGYVDEGTRFDMFTNDLVIVAGTDSAIEEMTLEEAASGKYKIAVGDDNVPAGNYAKQALSTVGAWIDDEGTVGPESDGKGGTFEGTPLAGMVTEGKSVGDVCSYANTGDVDLAFVYSSDVYRFGNVKIVGTVPADACKAIVYPAAVCAETDNADAAQAFLDWAVSDEDALKIWQEWGFELA